MNLLITATAGTMESNDIMVTLEPAQSGGIQISLTSNVLQQFGRQIEAVIRRMPEQYAWSYNRYKTPAGAHPKQAGDKK